MKKWIAPFLVLALAVLLIVCGKGITEKILERKENNDNPALKSHMSEAAEPEHGEPGKCLSEAGSWENAFLFLDIRRSEGLSR